MHKVIFTYKAESSTGKTMKITARGNFFFSEKLTIHHSEVLGIYESQAIGEESNTFSEQLELTSKTYHFIHRSVVFFRLLW